MCYVIKTQNMNITIFIKISQRNKQQSPKSSQGLNITIQILECIKLKQQGLHINPA